MESRKRRKCSKIYTVFLTESGLLDMSRKSVEADVKRKFDMRKKRRKGEISRFPKSEYLHVLSSS